MYTSVRVPASAGNPIFAVPVVFAARVLTADAGTRTLTVRRQRATDKNTFIDDPEEPATLTVGVPTGTVPSVGAVVRVWWDGLTDDGTAIFHA